MRAGNIPVDTAGTAASSVTITKSPSSPIGFPFVLKYFSILSHVSSDNGFTKESKIPFNLTTLDPT